MRRNGRFLNGGYALLAAVIAVAIFTVLLLKARTMWETEITRDLEQELLFRARQYAVAIELYKKKYTNLNPQKLDDLYEKKFLRQRFKDPMTESGTWNVVMRSGKAGKSELLLVPEEMVEQYVGRAMIIGVCSTSPEEGFMAYRKKKKYNEWAVYVGEQLDKDMPEFKFVGEGGDDESGSDKERESDRGDERRDDGRRDDGRRDDGRREDGRRKIDRE